MSALCVRVGVLVALVPTVAWADVPPLPASFALPPPCRVQDPKHTRYVAYGREEQAVAVPKAEKVELRGRVWSTAVACADQPALGPADNAARFATFLAAAGWKRVTQGTSGAYVREASGVESWLLLGNTPSGWFTVRLVEKSPAPRPVEIAPPAETVEELKKDAPPSWMPLFPGGAVAEVRLLPDTTFEVTPKGAAESLFVGRPTLRWTMRGPADLSPAEFRAVYVAAIERAGWTIVEHVGGLASDGDYVVKAHYAQRGRDLWMTAHAEVAAVEYKVADVGAAAAASRLKQELAEHGHVALYGIYFDTDKATLRPESEPTLQQVLALLRGDAKLVLRVEGHTDSTGAPAHNQTLSEARAASVKAWLVAHGVAATRLTPAGFAATRPVADNQTPEGRSRNRRVELARP